MDEDSETGNTRPNLEQLFADWTEPDDGMYYLLCLLGLVQYKSDLCNFKHFKSLLHSKNSTSDMLYKWLEDLVGLGMLEKQDDWAYRWNKDFSSPYFYETLDEFQGPDWLK